MVLQRMQQRRYTATQWTSSNDVLLPGELGIELDTAKWKIGDGTTAWTGLAYQPSNAGITAAINAAVANLVNGAPGALDQLNELSAALGNDANFAATVTNALAAKANTSSLAPVATAGTYTSLTGKPTLGTAAGADTTAFDAAGAATTAQAAAVQRANHTGTQPASTVTGLATVATTGLPGDLIGNPFNTLTTGQETFPRMWMHSTGVATGSGSLRLTYFTARKTETVTQVRLISGGTAAAATPTLVKVGLYSVNTSTGALTLAASTANTTSLFNGTLTTYTPPFAASTSVTAGNRYAVAVLVVTAATAPTLHGLVNVSAAEFATAPRITGTLPSQTDLPASITDASLSVTANVVYAAILP